MEHQIGSLRTLQNDMRGSDFLEFFNKILDIESFLHKGLSKDEKKMTGKLFFFFLFCGVYYYKDIFPWFVTIIVVNTCSYRLSFSYQKRKARASLVEKLLSFKAPFPTHYCTFENDIS